MTQQKTRSFAVIGLGTFGSTVASELARFDNTVLGIDIDERRVTPLAETLSETIIADGRDEDALREAGFGEHDVGLVAIGEDLEANILCTMHLRILGVKEVWAKAMSKTHHRILAKMDVDRVILAEQEMGQHIAQMLHNPLVRDYVSLGNGYHVVDLRVPEQLEGMSIFIPIAEESGQIVSIGTWVLEEACRQQAQWVSDGLQVGTIAVNVSPHQFKQSDFVDVVARVLKSTGLAPERLELEVTESLVMQDDDVAVDKLNRLHALGIKLAIDDFGTGYSSLSYLKRFPIHRLKIDQSFTSGLPENRESFAIIQAIIHMGHSLGLDVLAEGIENEDQEAELASVACNAGQGYLYSKSLAATDVEAFLLSRRG